MQFFPIADHCAFIRTHPGTLVEPGGSAGIGSIDAEAALVDVALVELAEGLIEQGKGKAAFAPSGTYRDLVDPADLTLFACFMIYNLPSTTSTV
ncbi:MAG: hypothetical protein ABI234_14375 [Ktedonobacteraceae bacterium]